MYIVQFLHVSIYLYIHTNWYIMLTFISLSLYMCIYRYIHIHMITQHNVTVRYDLTRAAMSNISLSLSLSIHLYIYLHLYLCTSLSLSIYIYIYIYVNILFDSLLVNRKVRPHKVFFRWHILYLLVTILLCLLLVVVTTLKYQILIIIDISILHMLIPISNIRYLYLASY